VIQDIALKDVGHTRDCALSIRGIVVTYTVEDDVMVLEKESVRLTWARHCVSRIYNVNFSLDM